MKRILSVITLFIIALTVSAQENITKFLGFPVDGTKQEMIKNLETKGFRYDKFDDNLAGEFNGENVEIHIVTDNNKVWRIAIFDQSTRDEYQIKFRFNRLYNEFCRNGRYLAFSNEKIPEDEHIKREMLLHDKSYEASFIQFPGIRNVPQYIYDSFEPNQILEILDITKLKSYSLLTEEDQKTLTKLSRVSQNLSKKYFESMQNSVDSLYRAGNLTFESLYTLQLETYVKGFLDPLAKWMENSCPVHMSGLNEEEEEVFTKEFTKEFAKATQAVLQKNDRPRLDFEWMKENNSVWFKIQDVPSLGYRIIMYYDNIYNQAHGEDL